MADSEASIRIDIDTSSALASIKNLQRQISAFHTQMQASGNAANAALSKNMQKSLVDSINSTGKFSANLTTIKSTTESFTNALEKNKLGMGEYFRYAGASTKTFGRLFKSEFSTIDKVARERVKTLQTQYIKMGRDASGALQAIKVRPIALDMQNLGTQTAMAAQKQALFNQLIKQGSTNLLNWGKNTQWAGRQLMVGFTIPLAIMGSVAVKEFKKIEEQSVKFRRVYGDMLNTDAETERALKNVKSLAQEFTKYGIAIEKTIDLAAKIAQMGNTGKALDQQVIQATRLSVLGGMEQMDALDTTISLTNAFGVSIEQLSSKINFLNAAENQTILAIEDFNTAIPLAGSVVKQLGGEVEDLAVLLTAMREGGINASQAGNALKSSLARLIAPSRNAKETLSEFGIDIMGIVENNAGNLMNTINAVAYALDELAPLSRARAIEALFGKFQFARMSTLFSNITREGSQANKVLELTKNSAEELAILAERELKRVEDSPAFKLDKQMEKLKAAMAPIGEEFVKLITPIVEFATKLLEQFNNMSDGGKQFVTGLVAVLGLIAPAALMVIGLVANGVANLLKGFNALRLLYQRFGASSTELASQTQFLTTEQLEAAAVAASLEQSHARLTQSFTSETTAIYKLVTAYQAATRAQLAMNAAAAGRRVVTAPPITRVPGLRRAQAPGGTIAGYNKGTFSVPGPKGAGDIIPAMLSPGEAVIPAKQSRKYSGIISSLIADNVPGFRFGRNPFASMLGRSNVAVRMGSSNFISALQSGGKNARYQSAFETQTGADYRNRSGSENVKQKLARSAMERDLLGLDPKTTPIGARPTYGYARTSPLQAIINSLFGIKGKRFNQVTGKSGRSLDLYGDLDLITKSSVAKRSSASVGDSLMNYVKTREAFASRRGVNYNSPMESWMVEKFSQTPMRGKGGDFSRFENSFGTPFGSNRQPGTNAYSVNPKPPYVETLTPGGFAFKEIDRIISNNPVIVKQLRTELKAAGLGGIRVIGSGFAARLFKKLGVPGYNKGIDSVPSLRRDPSMNFDQRSTLQMAHMSGVLDEGQALNRNQIKARFRREVEKGIRTGIFKEFGLNPEKIIAEFDKKLAASKGDKFKLYSSLVEPAPSISNQKTAGLGTERLGKQYLKDIKSMPRGLSAAGILARLPKNHGISSNELRSYIFNVEKAVISRLKTNFNNPLPESEYQKLYNNAEKIAVRKIKSPETKRIIKNSNTLSRLGLGLGVVAAPGSESGPTRKYLLSALGDMQKKTRRMVGGGTLGDVFGSEFTKNLNSKFLSQTKIDLPRTVKDKIQPLMRSLDRKSHIAYANALIETKNLSGSQRLMAYKAIEDSLVSRKAAPNIQALFPKQKTGIITSSSGIPKSPKTQVVGGNIADKRMMAVSPGEAILSEKSTAAIRRGGVASVPGLGRMGRFGPIKVPGAASGFPDGQTQERIGAANSSTNPDNPNNLKGRIARGAGGAGMLAGMGAMMYGMSGGPGADIASAAAFPLMMLPMLLPMLASTGGIAVIALGALAAGIIYLNTRLKDATKAGLDAGKAMSMTNEKLEEMSEFTGKVTASQIAARKKETLLTGESSKKRQFGQTYMESEPGQSLLADAEAMIKSGATRDVASNISNQLSYAIMQGAITPEQARSVAAALGIELQNYSIGISVSGQLTELFGANGEKLLNGDPLQISLAIQEKSVSQQAAAFENALSIANENAANDWVGATGAAITSVSAGLFVASAVAAASVAGAWAAPILAAAGAVTAAVGLPTLLVGNLMDQGDQEENNKARGVAVQLGAEQLAQNQGLVDSLERQYDNQIAQLKAEKNAAKDKKQRLAIEEKITNKIAERDAGIKSQKEANAKIFDSLVEQARILGSGFTDSIGLAIDERFKDASGAVKAAADLAKTSLSELENSDFKIGLQIGLASGEFDPVTISNLISANKASGGEMGLKYNLLVGARGTADANTFVQLLGAANVGTEKYEVFLDFIVKDKEDFDYNMQALSQIASMPMEYGFKVTATTDLTNDVGNFIRETKDLPETVTYDVVTKYLTDTKGLSSSTVDTLQGMLDNWEALTNGTNEVNYQVLIDVIIGKSSPMAIQALFAAMNPERYKEMLNSLDGSALLNTPNQTGPLSPISKAEMDEMTAAVLGQGIKEEKPPPTTPGSPAGSGEKKKTWIDDALKSLKNLTDASINARGGLKELKRVIDGNKLRIFDGLGQKFSKAGISEAFADELMDMGKRARKKFVTIGKDGTAILTKAGQRRQKAYDRITLGQFSLEQNRLLQGTKEQTTAVNKLTLAGMSLEDAYAAVEDEALAAAIAGNQLSKVALTKLVSDAKAAATALKEFQTVSSVRLAAEDANNLVKAAKALDKSKFSFAEKQAILSDSSLTELFLSGKNQKLLQARIKQILTPEFLQGIFDEGFNAAMDAFAIKERKIELDFEAKMKADFNIVEAAQNEIAGIEYVIDDLQAGLKEIEDQEEKINESYNKRIKALDDIKDLNSDIANQQKGQISVAEALSRGDISSAAKAIQELRASESRSRIDSQRKALELSREKDLSRLTSLGGKTRKQLEEEIKKLQNDIFRIEEDRLEPAQRRIDLATIEKNELIESITVLDRTRTAWANIENGIDLARIESKRYTKSITDAIAEVENLKSAWKDAVPGGTEVDIPAADPISSGGASALPARYIPGDTSFNRMVDLYRAMDDANRAKFRTMVGVGPGENYSVWKANRLSKKISDGNLNRAIAYMSNGKISNAEISEELARPFSFAKASGGYISGPGTATSDSIPAMLSDGEYVIRASSVDKFGKKFLDSINSGVLPNFNMGGKVPKYMPMGGLVPYMNMGGKVPKYMPMGGLVPYMNMGGKVPKYMPMGGLVPYMNMGGGVKLPKREPPPAQAMNLGGLFKSKGTDTVPAMLTPGEFVMRKYAVQSFGADKMKAINSGTYSGESVYNYSVNVNVQTDANADQIARSVMTQIKQIDSQRIRSNRF
jgi:TP901 family phage tail tape measure protein